MLQVEQLLGDVSFGMGTLRTARKRFSAQLAPEFRIFDYLRTDEMGVSQCIADLLDPNGKHGQGSVFLDAFLRNLGPSATWATSGELFKVSTEEQANGQRRIDIYLQFGNGIIGIENKPWAGDQDQQLSDYADHLRKAAGVNNWLLIYLSNRDPSESSIKKDKLKNLIDSNQFIQCDYAMVIEWLEACAYKAKALVVRIFIEELAKFIRMDINGELDMSEEHEINNIICQSPSNLSSAFQILKAMDGVKKELLNKFRSELESRLGMNGMKLGWGLENWQAYSGFIVQFGEFPQSLNLRFEFDQTNLSAFFWGIARCDKDYKDSQVWDEVNKLMSAKFGSGKFSEWWPWYVDLPDHEFSSAMKNWRVSEEPWVSIMASDQDENLAGKITDLALRVREVFKDHFHVLRKGVHS